MTSPARARTLVMVVLLVAVAALVLVLRSPDPYTITVRFPSASQLVRGNVVAIAGQPVGTVAAIDVSPNWQADVRLELDHDRGPLRQGTVAVIRQGSLSGVAARYVQLDMPDGSHQGTIPDGGRLPATDARSAVDIDQFFQGLGPVARRGLRDVIQGSADSVAGQSAPLGRGLDALPVSLMANDRLFQELMRDTPGFERFIVDSSALTNDVAQRGDDLTGLVTEVSDLLDTIGKRHTELGTTLQNLPPFLRRANTTFVNLRSTLDDLTPLIRESAPAARRLGPLLAQLRPFAKEARPTLRDLARALDGPGPADDLVDATRSAVALRDIAVGPVQRNGARREGALPAAAKALPGARGPLAYLRPYTPDLVGWFDDFSNTGVQDAFGSLARIGIHTSAFSSVNGVLTPVPAALRGQVFDATASLNQRRRCPGAAHQVVADGSNAGKPSPDFDCDPAQRPPGN